MDSTAFLDILTVVIVIAVLAYLLSDPGATDNIMQILDTLFKN